MKTKVFSILLAAILLVMGAVAQTTTQPAQTPATPAPAQTTAHPGVLSDAEIRNILIERIDTYHQSVGIVVGVIDASGRRVIAYGSLQKGDPRPLDGNTVFEIGSISKVFTSLLLADMVERGEVALNDPASKYLPATVKMPERGGKQITLIDLATHTSGLPPLPDNMPMKDQSNPYADYTTDKLYEFLSRYQLTRDPGSVYQYSNLGGGLLGHTLAQRAHTTYEKLVQTRITGPLGMNSTVITLTPELKSRFAAGHNAQLQTVSAWDIPDMMAGAGAIRSTANDMLTFLAANLGYSKTSLAPAMQVMVRDRRTAVAANLEVALGWHVFTANGHEIIWHNGGTGGFRTFVGYERKSGVGVVVLSNASTNAGVDDIGHHLLDTSTHLIDASAFKPIKEHKETAVDGKILDSYVGVYQLTPAFALTVTRDGNHLLVQATGQQQFSVFAESEHDFFAKVADVQFTFQTDAQGHATGIVLHQFGRNVPGKRVEAEPAK